MIFALNGQRRMSAARCSIVIPVHDRAGADAPVPGRDPGRPARGRRSRSSSSTTPRRTAPPTLLAGYGERRARGRRATRTAASRRPATTARRRRGRAAGVPQQRHDPAARLARRAGRARRRAPAGGGRRQQAAVPERHRPARRRGRSARTAIRATCTPAFPADHPAVNKSRPLPGRDRRLHARAAGRLRAGRRLRRRVSQLARGRRPRACASASRAHEVHYCHPACSTTSSRPRAGQALASEIAQQRALFARALGRSGPSATTSSYYLEDGLIRFGYRDSYPLAHGGLAAARGAARAPPRTPAA